MRAAWVLILVGCSSKSPGEPPPAPRPAPVLVDAVKPDAAPVDASEPEHVDTVAKWNAGTASPHLASLACIKARDRMIQYVDHPSETELRMCIDFDLQKMPSDVSCWSVDLASGTYASQIGTWFSSPQPLSVGDGGPELPGGTLRLDVERRLVCEGAACKPIAVSGAIAKDVEPVFDPANKLAAVVIEADNHVEIIDLAANKVLSTLPAGTPVGFIGATLVVTACDDSNKCTWDLVASTTGKTIAAVGGPAKLGTGGTADAVDDHRFVAMSKNQLIVQDVNTGVVTAKHSFPAMQGSYVAFARKADLVVASPEGRVYLVDRDKGSITKTLSPAPCR